VQEAIPPNAPLRGKSVVLHLFDDSDHAGNLMTRRSQIGYVQMVNILVINWHLKIQGLIEDATFGSELGRNILGPSIWE
jgi:hypothetical protein